MFTSKSASLNPQYIRRLRFRQVHKKSLPKGKPFIGSYSVAAHLHECHFHNTERFMHNTTKQRY